MNVYLRSDTSKQSIGKSAPITSIRLSSVAQRIRNPLSSSIQDQEIGLSIHSTTLHIQFCHFTT